MFFFLFFSLVLKYICTRDFEVARTPSPCPISRKSKQVGPTKKNKIKDNIKPSPPFLHFSIYILIHLAFNSCKQLFRYLPRLLYYSFINLFCLSQFYIVIIENISSSAFSLLSFFFIL